MNIPTMYRCRNCGSLALSASDDSILKTKDKATGKMIEQLCTCGGKFKISKYLFVVKNVNLQKVNITCKVCNAPYKRVSPHRFHCVSCSSIGFIQGKDIWFEATDVLLSATK